ncbi:rhodanese-like domain-containing protein [Janthinobacterium sp. 17J80-10]|uniref:rhodanese-like domain-containing protein n=1 Tax=Janthinobacterium sp. 17J80-10 TaxID=2497863 RepID=UPI0010059610|nr:rhodanese-like domain-containing protein [Janthinobacterium sp. 17J80-10]QAU33947.1 rhodanese-like domain-containing protein [Janthinobacterium sp. 17J80-10]
MAYNVHATQTSNNDLQPASGLPGGGEDAGLSAARQQAITDGLPYAGGIAPAEAWRLVQDGLAILVDVRTAEERKFVGYVPETVHVAWMTGTSMNRNPRFVKELEAKVKDKSAVILFLCRSGKRSAAAAEAATKAGFGSAFNILEGFEGDLNPAQQRGQLGGWRLHALPWVQD